MSAQLLSFSVTETANEAWNVYAALARAHAAEPSLAHDPDFNALMLKKHARFRQLFDRGGL